MTRDGPAPVYAYLTADTDNRIVRFRLGDDPGASTAEVLLDGIAEGEHPQRRRASRSARTGCSTPAPATPARRDRAQDPLASNGKILRMTPDGDVPPGNPTRLAGLDAWATATSRASPGT